MSKKKIKARRNARRGRDVDEEGNDVNASKLIVNGFEDVVNSEDEFHLGRDKVLLDETENEFKQRLREEKELRLKPDDHSACVLSLDESSEDETDISGRETFSGKREESRDEDGDDDNNDLLNYTRNFLARKKLKERMKLGLTDESNVKDDESDVDLDRWGGKKDVYYDTDKIVTEQDALDEEAEANRQLRERFSTLKAGDFDVDNDTFESKETGEFSRILETDGSTSAFPGNNILMEVLSDVDSKSLSVAERVNILHVRYPEFPSLADEWLRLHPRLCQLQATPAKGKSAFARLHTLQLRTLQAYVSTLTAYFCVLTSPANVIDNVASQLSNTILARQPGELRSHSVMQSLVECRELWQRVEEFSLQLIQEMGEEKLLAEDSGTEVEGESVTSCLSEDEFTDEIDDDKRDEVRDVSDGEVNGKLERGDEFEQFEELLQNGEMKELLGNEGEGGKEELIKDTLRRSLRFHASQILQRGVSMKSKARRDGGDDDLPYRETEWERRERLKREADSRMLKGKFALGDNKGDDDGDVESKGSDIMKEIDGMSDADLEYYDMVTQVKRKERESKLRLMEEKKAEEEETKESKKRRNSLKLVNGKRSLTYAILANKSITRRKGRKDVKNPRVKRRMQYEEKKKKLRSMRPEYSKEKHDAGMVSYGGELTGIKTGLVKGRPIIY